MSLTIYLTAVRPTTVYSCDITHNLTTMAEKAGLYEALWIPENKNWTHAEDIIPFLERGLAELKQKPDYFKKFNPSNDWGNYENLVEFVEGYLKSCKENPDAEIEANR